MQLRPCLVFDPTHLPAFGKLCSIKPGLYCAAVAVKRNNVYKCAWLCVTMAAPLGAGCYLWQPQGSLRDYAHMKCKQPKQCCISLNGCLSSIL